ncbi:hypothetical protein CRUP_036261, partial [Coryphaenoides rupestris]
SAHPQLHLRGGSVRLDSGDGGGAGLADKLGPHRRSRHGAPRRPHHRHREVLTHRQLPAKSKGEPGPPGVAAAAPCWGPRVLSHVLVPHVWRHGGITQDGRADGRPLAGDVGVAAVREPGPRSDWQVGAGSRDRDPGGHGGRWRAATRHRRRGARQRSVPRL